jgi:hypothetical protein
MVASAGDGALNRLERSRLSALESEIADGLAEFVRVGRALAEIQEGRLYRQDFLTFEAYCQERWGFGSNRGGKLIRAAEIVDSMGNNVTHRLATERQVSTLAGVPVKDRHVVVADAVKHSNRNPAALKTQGPTVFELEDAVRRYQERPSLEQERRTKQERSAREAEVLREYQARPSYTPPAAELAMDRLAGCFVDLADLALDEALRSRNVTQRRLVLEHLPAVRRIVERLEEEL